MTDEENEDVDVVESQKLSSRDKKQIQDGMCVNCALVSFIFTFLMMLAIAL